MCEVEHVAAQQRGQEHGMGTFVVLDGPQGAVLVTPMAPQEAENDGVSIRYLYTGKEISFLPNDRPGVTGKTTHAPSLGSIATDRSCLAVGRAGVRSAVSVVVLSETRKELYTGHGAPPFPRASPGPRLRRCLWSR